MESWIGPSELPVEWMVASLQSKLITLAKVLPPCSSLMTKRYSPHLSSGTLRVMLLFPLLRVRVPLVSGFL